MGFLDSGNTLTWDQLQEHMEYVREHGILQFIELWKRLRDRKGDCLKFGDEIEYYVVCVDEAAQRVTLSLRGGDILKVLQEEERALAGKDTPATLWHPEYGAFMVEGTPGKPYGDCVDLLSDVEVNMAQRRARARSALQPNERLLTLTMFPMLGRGDFTTPSLPTRGYVADSLYTPDGCINPHPRFATLTRNIRMRRGSNVDIRIPLFRDARTDPLVAGDREWLIHMDSMASGMGLCCVQTTFQCVDVDEARRFYDRLVVLAPIVMALSAACPIFRGFLGDRDVRWDVIAGSVDDRTPEERGLPDTGGGRGAPFGTLGKSRYGSVDCFMAQGVEGGMNDKAFRFDPRVVERLTASGVDTALAEHIAHLFVRDPLVLYSGKIAMDDAAHTDHFENFQSTNWQTVRFKPPPPGESAIGWRVEFRPMDCQFTDFENAAYVVFVVLLTRVIGSYNLHMYMPISKVDENMRRAQERDAIRRQKFFFPRNVVRGFDVRSVPCELLASDAACDRELQLAEMSLDEILNGSAEFCGLIPLMYGYLDTVNIAFETRVVVTRYLRLLERRAKGELMSNAEWIRHFVTRHPDYKGDSVISEKINYDLCMAVHDIEENGVRPKELFDGIF